MTLERNSQRKTKPFKRSQKFSESTETKTSTKQREQKAAKGLGAKAQPASGATPWAKEDLKDQFYLYQHKYTDKKSHSVKKEDLEVLRMNAIDELRDPVYVIDFAGTEWYMIPREQFTEFKALTELYYEPND